MGKKLISASTKRTPIISEPSANHIQQFFKWKYDAKEKTHKLILSETQPELINQHQISAKIVSWHQNCKNESKHEKEKDPPVEITENRNYEKLG